MPPNTLQSILLGICAVGILTAILCIPYYLYFHKPAPPTLVQYRVIVLLIFFALATIMSLLFNTVAVLEGDVVGIALKVTGPYAAFLVGLFLYLRWFDRDLGKQFNPMENNEDLLRNVMQIVRSVEAHAEWLPYELWKQKLNGFREINGREEDQVIRNFLEAAYGPNPGVLVNQTDITTLFIYLSNSVIKLQRISGKANGPTYLRFRSNSSYGTRGLRSFILVADDPSVIRIRQAFTHLDREGMLDFGYAEINYAAVECMIATIYPEYPEHEDYLMVSMPRFSLSNTGSVTLGIASRETKLIEPQVWTMRRSLASIDGQLPLSFKRFRSPPTPGIHQISMVFAKWAEAVDGYLETKRTGLVAELLQEIRESILGTRPHVVDPTPDVTSRRQQGFANALKVAADYQAFTFQARDVHDTTLMLFTWE